MWFGKKYVSLQRDIYRALIMVLDITEVKEGFPGISPVSASHLYESFEVVMHQSGHPEEVKIQMKGFSEDPISLHWSDCYDDQKERTYTDLQYTTEHGAVCLAVMLAKTLTQYTIIERSRKGTGVDYWLGASDDVLFQRKARLEVSGIFKGNEKDVARRFAEKVMQTASSDSTELPVFISVVEFGTPMANFNKR